MSQRESNLVWLKDVLEHLQISQEQLGWDENPYAVQQVCETMLRDLDCCKRLCETILRRARQLTPAH